MTTATIDYVPADDTDTVADLLLGVSHGDLASWNDILRRYGNLVSATVQSFRLQEADALDAVQMTWLRLTQNAHRVRFPERLGAWLATTARRECLHILRQTKNSPGLIDMRAGTVPDPSAGPEQRVIDADTTRILWQLVDELPPRRRVLLRTLFDDQPRSYADISLASGIPPGGIGPTRSRALRQLREWLDELEVASGGQTTNHGHIQ
ncbi:MAG: RNA polymerase sigma factor [Pseudonocardiaceae bacterium]